MRLVMPRDSDKDNDSRGRRGPAKGGRSGKPRGPEKKFAKRGFEGKGARDSRPPRGDRDSRPFRRREEGDAPRRDFSDRPRFKRDDRGSEGRGDRGFKPRGDRPFSDRSSRDGEKRPFKPRGDRPSYGRDDRPPRRDRDDARPAGRFSDKKFGDKKPYAPRGDRPERKFDGERKFSRGGPDRERDRGDRGPREDRGERSFKPRGDRPNFDRGDRAPRGDRPRKSFDKDFGGRDRGEEKPWRQRDDRHEGGRGDDRPRFSRRRDEGDDRPRFSRPREERSGDDRPRFNRSREKRPEGRMDWQEHPRSEGRFRDRPRRDNEDDSRIFEKRPAFGGRGAYRERDRDFEGRPRRDDAPKPKKAGERIAKVLARAGLASRRDAEEMVTQGRVTVNGRVINSPALDVTKNDVVMVDGKPLPERERTRLFLYHKPRGLMTTHDDPEGRPTVFDNLPEGLPRLISVGRLDFNTEGLLLLTNDGGLARTLELPDTGWLRRYRVRAHGDVTQAQLDELKNGIEVEGVKYGPIEATLERDQGANVWLVFAIREGKNREVRNVCAHLGLEVNRLIRVSYGPFQLGEILEGQVEEIRARVLREQLGDKVIEKSGAQFDAPSKSSSRADDAPSEKKPTSKRAVINDRKGRRVLVQRTGSEEARERNEMEANGYGPPRRPKRGYHGKRDLTPRED
ncbi:pseudouridine synthase [Bradyrhizobium sp. WBAH42]|nr:pseudouridine synthase [Bradyrhizobium sp. WBAH30]MDD1547729.1 pseudouridine synthase [Bradyrhizobium sp. WBAH41]MDD1561375.1 pseudouridine synthase [Bradyrhizobium sp. WBAH23]MDD1565930.1 pseudouridine synthase [Bradyrhizobium sp. WBAH33]MDD1594786.1 pseudouridine synthase [Bradyrhizobium sp. WBAH42]NRB92330.1 pseudouridine synthase [Bradyrhizobium sp. WBAH10]QCJ88729.1 pseudouridine synthase [Bradyrhizobium yuanmingense]